jgi:hypothetical protein
VIQNLIPNDAAHLKALLARNRVYDHIAMYSYEMLAVENSVLVLARSIYNLYCEVLVLISDNFAKGVLDGRVVGVDKVAVNELDCERTLAWLHV